MISILFSSDQKSWEDLKNFHFNHPTFPYLKMTLQRGSKMSKLDCAIPSIELESHKHVIYRESPFSTIKIERNHKIETKMHNKWRNQKIIWFWPHCCKSKFLKEFQDIWGGGLHTSFSFLRYLITSLHQQKNVGQQVSKIGVILKPDFNASRQVLGFWAEIRKFWKISLQWMFLTCATNFG